MGFSQRSSCCIDRYLCCGRAQCAGSPVKTSVNSPISNRVSFNISMQITNACEIDGEHADSQSARAALRFAFLVVTAARRHQPTLFVFFRTLGQCARDAHVTHTEWCVSHETLMWLSCGSEESSVRNEQLVERHEFYSLCLESVNALSGFKEVSFRIRC